MNASGVPAATAPYVLPPPKIGTVSADDPGWHVVALLHAALPPGRNMDKTMSRSGLSGRAIETKNRFFFFLIARRVAPHRRLSG